MQLLCILANPSTGTGARTLARVELAREILHCDSVVVENLFALASSDVTEISKLGAVSDGWLRAQKALKAHLLACDVVLLAYGVSAPSGPARDHHSQQVGWLGDRLTQASLPTFMVGDGPRHPSRWQRWTARQHPEWDFREALRRSLAPAPRTITARR